MAKLLCTKPLHEILIDDSFILIQDDSFIAIEIPNGFNWLNHAQLCPDCKAFADCFAKENYQWFLEINRKYYLVDLNDFSNIKNHFDNTFMFENSIDFHGTKLKIKISETNQHKLAEILSNEIRKESYENCAILRDSITFLEGK